MYIVLVRIASSDQKKTHFCRWYYPLSLMQLKCREWNVYMANALIAVMIIGFCLNEMPTHLLGGRLSMFLEDPDWSLWSCSLGFSVTQTNQKTQTNDPGHWDTDISSITKNMIYQEIKRALLLIQNAPAFWEKLKFRHKPPRWSTSFSKQYQHMMHFG